MPPMTVPAESTKRQRLSVEREIAEAMRKVEIPIPETPEPEVSPTERAFHVIEMTAQLGRVSTADIVTALGIPKTTAHRLVSNLEEFGFLEHGMERGRYQVGPRLLELATNILAASTSHGPIHALLMELSRRTAETTSLGVMRGSEVVYIDSAIGNSPLTLNFQKGHRAPAHCTSSGRVFLANMEKKQLDAYMLSGPWEPITPYTIVDPDRLRQEIDQVRKQGFATNDSEFAIGVVGAAVPIAGPNGRIIACLSISAPKARKSLEEVTLLVPMMEAAALRITKILTVLEGDQIDDEPEPKAPRRKRT
ncbi:HTH-type transcriptional regulator XynR [Paraburkholderia nemoris]|uniref:HTH-type transcriptional regulator XynR n=2 Tax=Paraburkholderia nemoris TaxID=2793076 RepID=A0ABN7LPI1_9BURK|nr:HTH-type transcriptional regulator XynR [Paraburkholderia nemoris]CAE6857230.1 HTH-type transcriptional regulator XynR [Paraburkholderia nemoris]